MFNREERVLGRRGARELTTEEASKINGGLGTFTVCSAPNPIFPHGDGDKGECP